MTSPREPLKSRPPTLVELVTQALRRWTIILLVGAVGVGAAYLLKDRFRLAYEADAAIRVQRHLKPPRVDTEVQVPMDDPPEPESIATTLMDEAASVESLGALFAARPDLFGASAGDAARAARIKLARKYIKIFPKTERHYAVEVEAPTPQQARALADWVAGRAVQAFRTLQLERYKTLARFTRKQADQARQALNRHEDAMIAFLRQHPGLLVRAMNKDRRLAASGPDRMRVQAVLRRAGTALGGKDAALARLLEQRNRLRGELRSIEHSDDEGAGPGASKLRQLRAAVTRVSELRARGLSDDHPSVKQARRQVERLRRETAALQPGQASGTSAYAARVQARLREVERSIAARLRRKAGTSSARLEARWGEMTREQRLLLRQYDGLRRLATSADFGDKLGDFEADNLARVIETASLPTRPTGIKPWMLIAAGGALSLLAGLLLALLIGGLDRKIYRAAEVEPIVRQPLLATLPRQSRAEAARGQRRPEVVQANQRLMAWSRDEGKVEVGVKLPADPRGPGDAEGLIGDGGLLALPPARDGQALVPVDSVVLDNLLEDHRAVTLTIHSVPCSAPTAPGLFITTAPQGPGADQVRLLASRLVEARQPPCRVVVVASWEPGAGRTTVAANLALALAESRRRTLLVDACGGDASLTRLLGLRPSAETALYRQLSDHMAGTAEGWTLYKVAEALSVIPADTEARPMAPMLSSVAFAEMVEQLQAVFDVLVFDSVAVSRVSDAVVLQQQADAVVPVVRRKRSRLPGLRELHRQLDAHRLHGVVFNEA